MSFLKINVERIICMFKLKSIVYLGIKLFYSLVHGAEIYGQHGNWLESWKKNSYQLFPAITQRKLEKRHTIKTNTTLTKTHK